MKLHEALKAFKTVRRIAEHLSISVQAVYAWGETVPPLRAYQLRELQCALVDSNGESKKTV